MNVWTKKLYSGKSKSEKINLKKIQKFKYSNPCPFGRGPENRSCLAGFRFLPLLPVLRFRPGRLDKSPSFRIRSNKRSCWRKYSFVCKLQVSKTVAAASWPLLAYFCQNEIMEEWFALLLERLIRKLASGFKICARRCLRVVSRNTFSNTKPHVLRI